MNEKVNRLLALREETLERAGREMWRSPVADNVIELLASGASVNLYMLRQRIEAEITSTTNTHLRGQLLGARDMLNDLATRN